MGRAWDDICLETGEYTDKKTTTLRSLSHIEKYDKFRIAGFKSTRFSGSGPFDGMN